MITLYQHIRGLGLPCRSLGEALRDLRRKYPTYWTKPFIETYLAECGFCWYRTDEIMREVEHV